MAESFIVMSKQANKLDNSLKHFYELLNDFLATMTEADFNRIMNEAIAIQPEI